LKIDNESDFGYSCDKTMALPHLGEIAMSNLNSNHIVKISDVAFDSKAEILYVTIPFSF
jgi:hypothetical protein